MKRNYVRNTERDTASPGGAMVMLAASMGSRGAAGAIEEQEASGQRQFTSSDVLPSDVKLPYGDKRNPDDVLRSLGFELGGPVEGDDLFRYATLPAGWSKKGTDHAMWSHIADEHGRERMSVFYKAAFYDRHAHARFTPRFIVSKDYGEHDRGMSHFRVLDAEQPVFESKSSIGGVLAKEWDTPEAKEWHSRMHEADDVNESACKAWLTTHGYGDWTDPLAYWDEPARKEVK